MAEREDNVYKAKLAEQAERYDERHLLLFGKDGQVVFYSDGPYKEWLTTQMACSQIRLSVLAAATLDQLFGYLV